MTAEEERRLADEEAEWEREHWWELPPTSVWDLLRRVRVTDDPAPEHVARAHASPPQPARTATASPPATERASRQRSVVIDAAGCSDAAAPAPTATAGHAEAAAQPADEANLQLVGRRIRLTGVVYRVVRYDPVGGEHLVQRLDRGGAPEESHKLRRGKYELLEADAHEFVHGASADDPLCAKCGQVQPGGIRSWRQVCVNEACGHRVAYGLGRASGVGLGKSTARCETLLAANHTPAGPDYRDGNGSDSGDEEGSSGSGGSASESDDDSDEDADEQAAVLPNVASVAAAAPNQEQPLPPPPPVRPPLPPPPPVAAAAPHQARPLPPELAAAVAPPPNDAIAQADALRAQLAAAVARQRAGALAAAAAPLPPVVPPPPPPPNDAIAQFDALRARLAANPPADLVTCKTDAAILAYRDHTQDRAAQALPAGWVTTAAGALSEAGGGVARLVERVVALTRAALAQGGAGVCIGPLNSGKCRYTHGGRDGRAKVYLWNEAGLQQRAQVIRDTPAGRL